MKKFFRLQRACSRGRTGQAPTNKYTFITYVQALYRFLLGNLHSKKIFACGAQVLKADGTRADKQIRVHHIHCQTLYRFLLQVNYTPKFFSPAAGYSVSNHFYLFETAQIV